MMSGGIWWRRWVSRQLRDIRLDTFLTRSRSRLGAGERWMRRQEPLRSWRELSSKYISCGGRGQIVVIPEVVIGNPALQKNLWVPDNDFGNDGPALRSRFLNSTAQIHRPTALRRSVTSVHYVYHIHSMLSGRCYRGMPANCIDEIVHGTRDSRKIRLRECGGLITHQYCRSKLESLHCDCPFRPCKRISHTPAVVIAVSYCDNSRN